MAAVPSSAVGVSLSVPEPFTIILNFSTLLVTSKLPTPIPTALQPCPSLTVALIVASLPLNTTLPPPTIPLTPYLEVALMVVLAELK